jgi:hypothetical protein
MLPQELLQPQPLRPVMRDRALQSPHRPSERSGLEIDPDRPDVVRQPAGADGVDGWDRATVCLRHQWASMFDHWTQLPACPLCVAEIEAAAGKARYADITRRLVLGL